MAKGCSQCQHCGTRLPLYLRLKDVEFCSPEHRDAHQREQQKHALERLIETEKILSQALASRLGQPLARTDPAGAAKAVEDNPNRPFLDASNVPALADPLLPRRPDSVKPAESAPANPAPVWDPRTKIPPVATAHQAPAAARTAKPGAPVPAPALPISPRLPAPGRESRRACVQPEPHRLGDAPHPAPPPPRQVGLSTPNFGSFPGIDMRAKQRPHDTPSAAPNIEPWPDLHQVARVVLAPHVYCSEPPKTSLRQLSRNDAAPPGYTEKRLEARAASLRAAITPIDIRGTGWAVWPMEIRLLATITATVDRHQRWPPAPAEALRIPCFPMHLPDRTAVLNPWFETAVVIAPNAAPVQFATPQPNHAAPKPPKTRWSAKFLFSGGALLGRHPEAASFLGEIRLNFTPAPVALERELPVGPPVETKPATLAGFADGVQPAPAYFHGHLTVTRPAKPSRFPAPVRAALSRSVIPPPASLRPLSRPTTQTASAARFRPNADFTPVRAEVRIPAAASRLAEPEFGFAPRAVFEHSRHPVPPRGSMQNAGKPEIRPARTAFYRLFRLVLVPSAYHSQVDRVTQARPRDARRPGLVGLPGFAPVAACRRVVAPPLPDALRPGISLIPAPVEVEQAVSLRFGTLCEASLRPADMVRVYSAECSLLEAEPDVLLPGGHSRQSVRPVLPLQPLDDTALILRAIRSDSGLRTRPPTTWITSSSVCDSTLPLPVPGRHWALGPVLDTGDLLDLHIHLEPQMSQRANASRVAGASFAPAAPVLPNEWNSGALPPPGCDLRSLVSSRAGRSRMPDILRRILPASNTARVALIAVPLLIAGLLLAGRPAASGARKSTEPGFFAGAFSSIRTGIQRRAGFQMVEDFRSGMNGWIGDGDGADSWKFDQTGFVQPDRVAIYRPSLGMSNYTMEFLGEVDRKALSWVFRARDSRNYYVGKLIIVRPGPLPSLALRRWAVVDGKDTPHKETVLPLSVRGDTLFEVKLQANGSDFTVYIGGRQADFWTDARLAAGGVGFFSGKGENSRIRWLRFEYQYDVLGRICAFLSPSVGPLNNRSKGSWE